MRSYCLGFRINSALSAKLGVGGTELEVGLLCTITIFCGDRRIFSVESECVGTEGEYLGDGSIVSDVVGRSIDLDREYNIRRMVLVIYQNSQWGLIRGFNIMKPPSISDQIVTKLRKHSYQVPRHLHVYMQCLYRKAVYRVATST